MSQWHRTCPTCTCEAWIEILSHHVAEAMTIAVGITLAGLCLSLLKVTL